MTRILVIDDAATVRMYHRKLLADAGWQVEEAGNGLEGLEQVHAQAGDAAFDLYVVDINMPKMDGYSFVRELRRLPARHQAPVVMVSTEAQVQDRSAALAAGANAYLVKPARPGALVLTAALLLGERATALRAARKVPQ
ncbi:response regulator [Caldimonas tepidiphila]|uniref:response regulator n=1 Tax=Caldimonas tepidiphila TaxID=2315841 RepID=UPI000E5B3DBA|nr:response regulator [Caldimonas tepidiphila]